MAKLFEKFSFACIRPIAIASCAHQVRNQTLASIATANSRNMSLFCDKKKQKTLDDPFVYVRAVPEDTPDILDLMWEAFYPDEPVTRAAGLHKTRNEVFDQEMIKAINKGLTILARCKYNGCLVGGCINNVLCPWDASLMEKFACTLKSKKMAELYMFLAYVQQAPDLFNKYCTSQVFEISSVFVRHGDRKKGVARKLIDASRALATDLTYSLIRVDATNIISAKACERLKMKLVYELPYCSYIGEDMEPIFKINEPHKSVKVYIDAPLRRPKK